tara:strand:- start:6162 stop:6401 length:240 start_codon:yes stop_codon:yes gene_type:complete
MITNLSRVSLSIILFLILYSIINVVKPNFIFDNKKNTVRNFGVGYKNTTVLTLWIVSIALAIFSYFIVIYYYQLINMWF